MPKKFKKGAYVTEVRTDAEGKPYLPPDVFLYRVEFAGGLSDPAPVSISVSSPFSICPNIVARSIFTEKLVEAGPDIVDIVLLQELENMRSRHAEEERTLRHLAARVIMDMKQQAREGT